MSALIADGRGFLHQQMTVHIMVRVYTHIQTYHRYTHRSVNYRQSVRIFRRPCIEKGPFIFMLKTYNGTFC